jgi:hypothetical protein
MFSTLDSTHENSFSLDVRTVCNSRQHTIPTEANQCGIWLLPAGSVLTKRAPFKMKKEVINAVISFA